MRIGLAYRTPHMLQLVEMAGRTCYRSEAKISADSASGFVSRIVARGHESVIEHSNVVFSLEDATADLLFLVLRSNRFLTCVPAGNTYYLAGNIRMFKDLVRTLRNQMNQADESGAELLRKLVEQFYNLPQAFFTDFVEAGWMKAEGFAEKEAAEPIVPKVIYQEPSGQVVELLHLDSPNVLPEWLSLADRELLTTCTVRITTSRDSSLQEVRHRPAAYSQESQRYVDLQNRLEYIHPAEIPQDVAFPVDLSGIPALSSSFLRGTGEGETVSLSFADMIYFTKACYTALRQAGFSPEVARGILPNATKTTIVVTRSLAQWRHYLALRGDRAAQRPIRERAHAILGYLQRNGWLQDLML